MGILLMLSAVAGLAVTLIVMGVGMLSVQIIGKRDKRSYFGKYVLWSFLLGLPLVVYRIAVMPSFPDGGGSPSREFWGEMITGLFYAALSPSVGLILGFIVVLVSRTKGRPPIPYVANEGDTLKSSETV